MNILVNGKAREVHSQQLTDVLVELGYVQGVFATAVNGEFVAAATRGKVMLHANDQLEVVAPMQGG